MITWESGHRVKYKAARASVTDTSIEVRRSTTAATAPTKPTTSLTSSNIKEDILTQPRRRSADISNRKIKYIMKEMSDIVGRELMDYNLRDAAQSESQLHYRVLLLKADQVYRPGPTLHFAGR